MESIGRERQLSQVLFSDHGVAKHITEHRTERKIELFGLLKVYFPLKPAC